MENISIPQISEIEHKIKNISKTNIKKNYQEESQTVQFVHKQDNTAADLKKVLTTLPLNSQLTICVDETMAFDVRRIAGLKQLVKSSLMLNIWKN